MTTPLKLGTRGSRLALWQAHWVRDAIQERLSREVELVILRTQGDKDQSKPVTELGGVGVFVKELERALLEGDIDLAVHSLKDLPTDQPAALCVPAYPIRKSPVECLICHPDAVDRDAGPIPLREGAKVGTASLRRRALLLELRPDLEVAGIRGNVPTRVDKARQGEVQAVMLAAAGIDRLELALEGLVRFDLPLETVLPAPGQGALAIQVRAEDTATVELIGRLDDRDVREATGTERALLAGIGAGCSVPLGTFAWREGEDLVLKAVLQVNPTDAQQPVLRRARVRAATPEIAAAMALAALAPVAEGSAPDLSGQRVLIARGPERGGELAEAIGRAGGQATCRAATKRVSIPVDASQALARAAWVAFASVNAVEELALAVGELETALAEHRVGAVGAATARALAEHGVSVDVLPERSTGAGLAEALLARLGDARPPVLLPAARGGRPELGDALSAAGCGVERIELYESQALPAPSQAELDVDAIVLANPAGARATLAGSANLAARLIAIGPTTAAAIRDLGHAVAEEASSPTVAGLLAALA